MTNMRKLAFIAMAFLMPFAAQAQEFKPKVKIGAGAILQTVYQQVPSGGSTFEPAMLKVGFFHTDLIITDKLSAAASWAFHSGKLSDAFVKYAFDDKLVLQAGRFKGAGTRAGFQTVQYDCDFGDFTYLSENMAGAIGAPDFRFYGIDISGKTKFMMYKFTLHNSGSTRTHYYTGVNDGPKTKNNGLEFRSWDALVSFYPMQNVEVGGHFGSVNRPGMGRKVNYSYSGHLYYVMPDKFKLKIDGGGYKDPQFLPGDAPDSNMDYSLHSFINSTVYGVSALAGYHVTPNIEPVMRYEYANHGDQAKSGRAYRALSMWTIGANFYLFPQNKRLAKVSAFYQRRSENGMEGHSLKNDWVGIAYQIYLQM